MNEIIQKRREEMKLSQSALAKRIGISQQHLDRYEKGYPIPLSKIAKVADVLGIDKAELLPPELRSSAMAYINKVGYVQAGKFNEACQLPESEWEQIPYSGSYPQAFALGVLGDSMNLVFPPEVTTLICVPLADWIQANPETSIEGKYVIVYKKSPDGKIEATVKKYTRVDFHTIILVAESSNPEIRPIVLTPDNNEYEIHAVVVSYIRNV